MKTVVDARMKEHELEMTIGLAYKDDEVWEDIQAYVERDEKEVIENLKYYGSKDNCSFDGFVGATGDHKMLGRIKINGYTYDLGSNTCKFPHSDKISTLTLYDVGGKVIDLSDEKTREMHKRNLAKFDGAVCGRFSIEDCV